MDSAEGVSEEAAVPDDFGPDAVSVSDDDENMSLSEDEEGNVVSKKPVAKRSTAATRSRAKAVKPPAAKKAKPAARAAKKASQKPVARRTRAKSGALPNLIRKHDLGGLFSDSSDEDIKDSTSYSKAVDFRHMSLKQDHSFRCVL